MIAMTKHGFGLLAACSTLPVGIHCILRPVSSVSSPVFNRLAVSASRSLFPQSYEAYCPVCDRRNAWLDGAAKLHHFLSRHRGCIPEWASLSAEDFRFKVDDEMRAYVRRRRQELRESPPSVERRPPSGRLLKKRRISDDSGE